MAGGTRYHPPAISRGAHQLPRRFRHGTCRCVNWLVAINRNLSSCRCQVPCNTAALPCASLWNPTPCVFFFAHRSQCPRERESSAFFSFIFQSTSVQRHCLPELLSKLSWSSDPCPRTRENERKKLGRRTLPTYTSGGARKSKIGERPQLKRRAELGPAPRTTSDMSVRPLGSFLASDAFQRVPKRRRGS